MVIPLGTAAIGGVFGINAAINGANGGVFGVGGTVVSADTHAFSASGRGSTRRITVQKLDPVLSVAPTLVFGNVLVGNTATSAVTVRNTGDSRTRLIGQFGGAGSAEFTPDGVQSYSVSGGGTTGRSYSYTPTARGADTDSVAITSQLGSSGAADIALSGTGVAPRAGFNTLGAANTRIGTSRTASVVVINNGDGNLSGLGAVSKLSGTSRAVAAGSQFSGGPVGFSIGDGQLQALGYSFTPTSHGAAQEQIQIDFDNGSTDDRNQAFTSTNFLIGNGVGPELGANHAAGDTIDFGEIRKGEPATVFLDLGNITPDADLVNLTALSLLGYSLSGPDAAAFAFGLGAPIVLNKGDTTSLAITFDPQSVGNFIASLTLSTDVNAAFGQAGDIFTLNLVGSAVPTPASFGLLGLGLMGLLRSVRRRDREGAGGAALTG